MPLLTSLQVSESFAKEVAETVEGPEEVDEFKTMASSSHTRTQSKADIMFKACTGSEQTQSQHGAWRRRKRKET